MICDSCHDNAASVHLQEMVQGVKHTLHLCLTCAAQKKIAVNSYESISVAEFLLNFSQADKDDSDADVRPAYYPTLTCSDCGITSDEFLKSGRLGCAGCYDEFDEILRELLPSIHPGTEHVRSPAAAAEFGPVEDMPHALDATPSELGKTEGDISDLQEDLKAAVARENFEQAAELRDKIRVLRDSIAELPVAQE